MVWTVRPSFLDLSYPQESPLLHFLWGLLAILFQPFISPLWGDSLDVSVEEFLPVFREARSLVYDRQVGGYSASTQQLHKTFAKSVRKVGRHFSYSKRAVFEARKSGSAEKIGVALVKVDSTVLYAQMMLSAGNAFLKEVLHVTHLSVDEFESQLNSLEKAYASISQTLSDPLPSRIDSEILRLEKAPQSFNEARSDILTALGTGAWGARLIELRDPNLGVLLVVNSEKRDTKELARADSRAVAIQCESAWRALGHVTPQFADDSSLLSLFRSSEFRTSVFSFYGDRTSLSEVRGRLSKIDTALFNLERTTHWIVFDIYRSRLAVADIVRMNNAYYLLKNYQRAAHSLR